MHPAVGLPLERLVPKRGIVIGENYLPEGTTIGVGIQKYLFKQKFLLTNIRLKDEPLGCSSQQTRLRRRRSHLST